MISVLDKSKLDDVMNIWLTSNIKVHNFINESFWINNYDYVKEILPQADVFTYEQDDKIVGFVGVVDKNYIAGLFVSNDYQSIGIGSKLIEECKLKYKNLNLHVYTKNTSAIEFYKKRGFVVDKEQMNDDTNELEYEMTWTL